MDEKYVSEFAGQIQNLFPWCPRKETLRIAEYACEKYSGRVGRTAMAKEFDSQAIVLAVKAHIRHEHTNYDELLMKGWERFTARDQVENKINQTLEKWQRERR